MKKLYLIYILAFLLPLCVYAQKDTQAQLVLQKAEQAIQKSSGIKAKLKGSFNGDITLKGEKFILESDEMQSWFDGTTQWTYSEETQEVNIYTPTPEELQSIHPYILLQTYKQGYNYLYKGKSTRNGQSVYEVTIIPEKNPNNTSITLLLSDKYMPVYLCIEQNHQIQMEISVTSYQMNLTIDDKEFTFYKSLFPEAEIIDMR